MILNHISPTLDTLLTYVSLGHVYKVTCMDVNLSNFHDQKHLLAFEKHWLNGKNDDNHSFDDNNAFDDDGHSFDDDDRTFDEDDVFGEYHAFDDDHGFGDDAHGLRWWRWPPLQERPLESRHYSDINQVAPQALHDNDDDINTDDHHHNHKT